jgi:hypothetical protein
LAFGSFSTNRVGSSNNRATVGHLLKLTIVAAVVLFAMSREVLIAEDLGVGPIPVAMFSSAIDSKRFDPTPLGHDLGSAQKVRVQNMAEKNI